MPSISESELGRLLDAWRVGDGPIGQRLGARLVALADEQVLSVGLRLPTERALAATLQISRSTATAAYRHARDAGRLVSRQGAGTWVSGPSTSRSAVAAAAALHPSDAGPGAAFDTLGHEATGVIDLSLAETRCDGHTRAVLADACRPAPGPGAAGWLLDRVTGTGYHPQGLPELRQLIAVHLHAVRTGTSPISPDDVLVTTGAQQAIALSAAALAVRGSTVLVEEASYPGALETFRRAGLRILPVGTDERGPDPSALADLIARTRPALAYLIPVGNNPTGVVIPGERLDQLAEVLARTGVTVLEDRTAAPLGDPARLPAPLSARLPAGSTVTIGSTSKVAWAGLRTGWAVAAPRLLQQLLAARLAADLAGSLISQSVAVALLPHLDALAAAVRADLARNQRALAAALAAELPLWSSTPPQAGAWRWVRIPADAQTVARAAATEGVLVTPGPVFSAQAGLADRLRIAAVAPPDALAEGVRRLRRAWTSVAESRVRIARGDGRDMLLI